MRTENIKVKLRDGEMGAYIAYPDKTPVGAIIAIMEIWGVNDTMRQHAHEFAEAGFVCLVPDLFWRQEPGVELVRPQSRPRAEGVRSLLRVRLRPRRPRHGGHLALPAENPGVQRQGRRGRLLPRRQALLPDVLPHRHRLRGGLLRHLHRAPHQGGEEPAPAVRAAHGDEGPLGAGRGQRHAGAAAVAQSAGDHPQISRRRPRLRPPRRQDLLQAGGRPGAGAHRRLLQKAPWDRRSTGACPRRRRRAVAHDEAWPLPRRTRAAHRRPGAIRRSTPNAGQSLRHYVETHADSPSARCSTSCSTPTRRSTFGPDDIERLEAQHGRPCGIEPITLLGALAAVTQHIGLVATATTTYLEPFHVARMFASLDQLSEGRSGWNVVTSSAAAEAFNFSHAAHAAHADRYERATEFIAGGARACGTPSRTTPSCWTRRRACSSTRTSCTCSITRASTSRCAGR